MAVDWDALARAHMAKQVTDAATVQAALARLWDGTIDPGDVTRTFPIFRARAVALIESGRSISKAEAQRYFEAVHNISGLDSELADVYERGWEPRYAASSLSFVTGKPLARAEALYRSGQDPSVALLAAKDAMLGSAKRHMLNAGRERILGLTRTSGYGRWARVSDGSPCAFCSMLVSRGPVYTSATVSFDAHDRCGCSARPVLTGESGWSPQARALRAVWDEVPDAAAFRSVLRAHRTGGESIYADLGPDGPATLLRALAALSMPAALAA